MITRRDLLKLAATLTVAPVVGDRFFGAIKPAARSRRVSFHRAFTATQRGKKRYLWIDYERKTGRQFGPYGQGSPGDCVGHANANGVNLLANHKALASVEMIYAGARNEVGKGKMEGQEGCEPEWAAQWLRDYGALFYPVDGCTKYKPEQSTKYQDIGVPDELEPVAKRHPVRTYTRVSSHDEAYDALWAGQPVTLCCSYAVDVVRNTEGFVKLVHGGTYKSRRRWFSRRNEWHHAWLLCGYDDRGAVILNSWPPDWISGPQLFLPPGAFRLTHEDLDIMIKDWGTCFALSSYLGQKIRLY